jgi:hypothetical protein
MGLISPDKFVLFMFFLAVDVSGWKGWEGKSGFLCNHPGLLIYRSRGLPRHIQPARPTRTEFSRKGDGDAKFPAAA